MAKIKSRVSKSLQDTVKEHEHIDQVHFTAQGDHYFNVHKFEPTLKGDKTEAGLYGRIHTREMINNETNVISKIHSPIASTKIVESVDREDVLAAEAESDFVLTKGMLNTLAPDAREAVEKIISGKGKVKVEN